MTWIRQLSREMSLFAIAYSFECHHHRLKELFGFNCKNVIYTGDEKMLVSYKDPEELEAMRSAIRQKAKNQDVFVELLQEILHRLNYVQHIVKEFSSLPGHEQEKKVMIFFETFHPAYETYWAYHLFQFLSPDALEGDKKSIISPKAKKLLTECRKTNPYLFIDEILLPCLANIIAKREKTAKELEGMIYPQEMYDYFHKTFVLDPKELEKRKECYALIMIDGRKTIFSGQNARERVLELVENEDNSKGQEVKGVIAWKGKVTGRVRIIKYKKDFNKFEQGDILVTHMTTTDFLPLIKKAAAIITDEGGIGCHAAILSRELKKPCLIGTKCATQVFKDDDLVRVDAEKGIVKKL
ncbi:hypothetical protein J4460_04220 [Candidatus Woesearchaeota archaeon]|nr:hypothetical protein [Candidatus Woesearchaeota archaeon]HIH37320.1 hypothetical protein [Candidatus Woesearchaeota archaeon]HIH48978.1 hypothetical protein [Candidatus Woesearchaeota archaeon]HIJ03063.1 hypothetical protein [Candidatus Woesearchaeota archaeon]